MMDPEYPPPARGGYVPPGPPAPPGPQRVTVDAGKLWAGGAATALVAALVAIVGLLVAMVLGIDPLRPLLGEGIDRPVVRFAVLAAAGALLATALMHALIYTTPRPQSFFTWIVILVTAVAALLPFLRDATIEEQAATSLIYIAVGLCIGSLVTSVAARSLRPAA
jgi:hypothetical protein